MAARSIIVNGVGSGSAAEGDFSFPGDRKPLNGQGSLRFFDWGVFATSGAERLVPFFPSEDIKGSGAITTVVEGLSDLANSLKTSRVWIQKRETTRSILGDSRIKNQISIHSALH
jgi:hypothetical protein